MDSAANRGRDLARNTSNRLDERAELAYSRQLLACSSNLELVLDDGTLALRVEVARQAIEMMSTTSARDFAAGSAEQRTELLSGLYGSFRHHFGAFLAHFPASHRPTRAV